MNEQSNNNSQFDKEYSIEELMELSSTTEEFLFDDENLCSVCSHTCSGSGTITD